MSFSQGLLLNIIYLFISFYWLICVCFAWVCEEGRRSAFHVSQADLKLIMLTRMILNFQPTCVFQFLNTGITGLHHHAHIYGCWGSNPGLHSCWANYQLSYIPGLFFSFLSVQPTLAHMQPLTVQLTSQIVGLLVCTIIPYCSLNLNK